MAPPVQNVLHVRASKAWVLRVLRQVPHAAAHGVAARALLVRLGLTALGRIKGAFVVKARGGTDEAGERWAPLSRRTIAYGRRHRKIGRQGQVTRRYLPRGKARSGYAPSYALTDRQRARWWDLYRQGVGRYGHTVEGKAHAAAYAWFRLKQEGGVKTLMDLYGSAGVEILRDTGLLFNSLSPGVAADAGGTNPPKPPHQVFRVSPGLVIVGTNRKGAASQHRGIPGRLPQRRLWPAPARWPASWWNELLEACTLGVADLIVYLLRRTP
jgi:hypothetical protein